MGCSCSKKTVNPAAQAHGGQSHVVVEPPVESHNGAESRVSAPDSVSVPDDNTKAGQPPIAPVHAPAAVPAQSNNSASVSEAPPTSAVLELMHRPVPKVVKSLANAAKTGDLASVQARVADGADVNTRGMWDSTPLICACQYKHAGVALFLIPIADIAAENEKFCTAMLHAALEGMADVVAALLAAGAPHDTRCGHVYNSVTDMNQWLTPLAAAALNGHEAVVSSLLAAGADPNRLSNFGNESDPANATHPGRSPLMLAASRGQVSCVRLLLGAGASVHVEDTGGWSAVLLACFEKHDETAVQLIHAGAGPGWHPIYGSALHFAAERGLVATTAAFAVQLGSSDASQELVNRRNSFGLTPLLLACGAGGELKPDSDAAAAEIVKLLLAMGGDASAASPAGQSPLQCAKEANFEGTAAVLHQHLETQQPAAAPTEAPRHTVLEPAPVPPNAHAHAHAHDTVPVSPVQTLPPLRPAPPPGSARPGSRRPMRSSNRSDSGPTDQEGIDLLGTA